MSDSEVYETKAVVTLTGSARDMDAVTGLLRSAIEELNSGRWGEPFDEIGTMLEIHELGSGGTNEAQYVRLQLRRHGAAAPAPVARSAAEAQQERGYSPDTYREGSDDR